MRPLIAAPAVGLTDLTNALVAVRPDVNQLFVTEMMPALYRQAVRHRLDVFGMVAQSYLETAGGYYTGRVQPWFHNTCGLKVRAPDMVRQTIADEFYAGDIKRVSPDHALVHSQWLNWDTGAMAHAQHLCAYAGLAVPDAVVDPRWSLVWGNHQIRFWDELSGRWAGITYAQKFLPLAQETQDWQAP